MSITTAIHTSLTSPRSRSDIATGKSSGNAIADTLSDMLEGVAEIERHARQSDPRNVALLGKLAQLKVELQAAAQSAGAGMARLSAAMRGPASGSSAPSSGAPF
jgi:hypothetical protein